MDFIKHPQHTRFIGKPADWNEQRDGPCGTLSVFDTKDAPSGYPVMESAWLPTPEEALAIATGYGHIRLGVFGRTHPVIYMGLGQTTPADREEFRAKLKKAAEWLQELAAQGNINLIVNANTVSVADKEPA